MSCAKSWRNLISVVILTIASLCLAAYGQRKATTDVSASGQPQLMIKAGHSSLIVSVAVSPDNKFVVTGSHDKTARLWDVKTGAEIHSFEGHSAEINSVAVSPNGSYILTGSDDETARLWSVDTGKELRSFQHSAPVKTVAFMPNSTHVLTVDVKGVVHLWDVKTGTELRKFATFSESIWAAAVSSDGKRVLVLSINKIGQLWDVETGNMLQQFKGDFEHAWTIALSPNGKHVLIASKEEGHDIVHLWETETGKEIYKLNEDFMVISAVFSPDGKYVVTGGTGETLQMREVETGKKIRSFKVTTGMFFAVAFSRDGKYLLGAYGVFSATLWNAETEDTVSEFGGHAVRVQSAVFSPDGKYVLTGGLGRRVMLWDLEAGKLIQHFAGHKDGVSSVAFSPNGEQLLTGSLDGTAALWDAATGKELYRLRGHRDAVNAVAFSLDGQYVLTGSTDKTARLWDAKVGKELRKFEGHMDDVDAVAFSPTGEFVLTGSSDKTARLWEASTGKEIHKFDADSISVDAVAFTHNGERIITAGGDIRLWEVESKKELLHIDHEGMVRSVAFTSDESGVLVGDGDGILTLWDLNTKKIIRTFKGHQTEVESVAVSPNSKYVLTAGGYDGTARLWDFSTGKEICKLTAFFDGEWVIVAPNGRFDASGLDEIEGLSWIVPDDLMHPVPLEIFMRDYYEPRLLPRLIDDVRDDYQFKRVRALGSLNRVQPDVKIVDVQLRPGSSDTALVTVEVSQAEAERKRGSVNLDKTGVFDLRLFRDGQLVGYWPTPHAVFQQASLRAPISNTQQADKTLEAWRSDAEIQLTGGKLTKTFTVQLSHNENLKEVNFTAYAFNRDRVRSKIARKTFTLTDPLPTRKGRAYIISVGVNLSEIFRNEPANNLDYADKDAEATSQHLFESLTQTGDYEDVIRIKLIANKQVKTALKANVQAVLEVLAGKIPAQELRRLVNAKGLVPDIDKLRKATPDDLVIISFSSHGIADAQGNFFIYPYDTGSNEDQLLQRSISSEELALWLIDVDAGDLLMVIDACRSGAATGTGFKAGPMDSRGLGQLAYDKGMKILAATQANSSAVEIDDLELNGKVIRGGLLTYVLIDEAIKGKKAMGKASNFITAKNWMSYAVAEVPKLYAAVAKAYEEQKKSVDGSKARAKGAKRRITLRGTEGKRLTIVLKDGAGGQADIGQKPTMFDFTKRSQEIVIARF